VDWIFVVGLRSIPLTPALSPKGERGKGADLYAFQNLSSAQELPRVEGKGSRSICFSESGLGSGIAEGRGEREQIFVFFKTGVRLRNFRSVYLEYSPRSVPSPSGRGLG
jgi:hypothetical protein